jgi:DNA-binding IscR family transcriptional regulator
MNIFHIFSVRQRKALEALVEIVAVPNQGKGAAELARSLGMSRESVYQLLLPLVQAGFLIGDRGRKGGYRAAEGTVEKPVSVLLGLSRDAKRGVGPVWILRIERRAGKAILEVLDTVTLKDLLDEMNATRSAPSWDI